jgi:hypothetical protein
VSRRKCENDEFVPWYRLADHVPLTFRAGANGTRWRRAVPYGTTAILVQLTGARRAYRRCYRSTAIECRGKTPGAAGSALSRQRRGTLQQKGSP